jgi:hypothetical protein
LPASELAEAVYGSADHHKRVRAALHTLQKQGRVAPIEGQRGGWKTV